MIQYAFNAAQTREEIVSWLRELWHKEHMHHVVIGISGGKDSTVAAALCIEAFDRDNVTGLLMPNGTQSDIQDSYDVCKSLGLTYKEINIHPAYKELMDSIGWVTPEAAVNVPPRIRMTVLYAFAQSNHARVCGTGNLSERTLGYFTKWGDGACDFNPLGNLTSVEVVAIGDTYSEIPARLIHKVPHDGLGIQTDEEKLGISYADVHSYLRTGLPSEKMKTICEIIHRQTISEHKRKNVPMFGKEA